MANGFVEVFGTQIPDVPRQSITPSTPIIITGVAPRTINFPAEFTGYALDVIIDNLDAVGTLTFRLNNTGSGAVGTISPSGAFLANDQKIVVIQIVTGANWQVTFSLVPLPKAK